MKKQAVIVGYGGMGAWHHKALQEIGKIDVIGIYDIREEVFEKAAKQNLTIFQNFQAVLESSAEIIIIATPNDSHKDYCISALEAGKHVVCEKPVTLSVKDLEEIIAVSQNSAGIFTVHQNRRWDTDFRIVQKILSENIIDTPYFIESRVNGSSVFLHGWRDFKVNGGGMLYDWGVHLIDQLLLLTPAKVTSVTAHVKSVFSEEVDDNVKLLLGFSDGLSVLVEIATNCFIPFPRWHLSGKAGTAIIDNWEGEGKIIQLLEGSNPTWSNEIVYTAAGPTRTMAPRAKKTVQEVPLPMVEKYDKGFQHNFYSAEHFYSNLVDAINGKEEQFVKEDQILRVLKVIEAAFESAEIQDRILCTI
ncbi:Gfo/Idh/MocA family protein [Jeotgalibaca ciconiae]|uniref:Gfo/Idh/MocA family oxidoreductase n=1 Tax=Jeotgalibaca ciconiae TaxID=2496265 RepID=A0A3S9HBP2_9LACT|nr:Gfo/Idh/MocA family oxidoreductase [Jeotgalibaca ciconiae]AZP04573.1 Gfo/Idh/MocA family oxidoreductase [Jeotgalibaca ciconiae]HJB24971.1 Gfo/Idh/MocA family oxidoreductase [Candidatus Jeotgalibaca pullicola]